LIELEELCIEVLRRQLHPFVDDLAAAVRIVRRRHEHVPPDGGHLRPVLLAQDVGQALPPEARSDHIEVAIRVDVELHAVRGEPGLQDRMEPPSEVPSVLRGPEQDDLRLLPPDQLGHHLCVRARTDSFASPEKIRPARGGSRIVSTLATIVGELSSPTFFGSIPTSAQDQWTITPPRFTRIFPVNVGERGLLHPKFTVQREGMFVCHHSVPSSAVRRARTVLSTIRTSDT